MQKLKTLLPCLALSSALVISGCASTNTQKGAAIGAVLGAIAGKATGDHAKSRYAWGAVVGAIAGSAIGSYMDKQEQELKEELAGSGVKVHRVGNDIYLEMPGDITFDTNSSRIYSQFYPVLQDVAKVLNKYEKTYLQVEGHTDSTGSSHYNQTLSESRAQSVKSYLVQQNVNQQRVGIQGYGETQPIADNNTTAGRASNRRVELRIIPNT